MNPAVFERFRNNVGVSPIGDSTDISMPHEDIIYLLDLLKIGFTDNNFNKDAKIDRFSTRYMDFCATLYLAGVEDGKNMATNKSIN